LVGGLWVIALDFSPDFRHHFDGMDAAAGRAGNPAWRI